jgi:hypothetical protein
MTKPRETTPSAEAILGEWNNRSGFALEMRVMQALRRAGWECTHGLTYSDPKTKLDRQFDLRATRVRGNTCMRLAIECKEVSPQYPLVFGLVPRDTTEAGHQLVVSSEKDLVTSDMPKGIALQRHALVANQLADESLYAAGAFVAKGYMQVSGNSRNGPDELYSRLAQAIASASDHVDEAHEDYRRTETPICMTFILPLVVVPDGGLWAIDHDEDGNRANGPVPVDAIEYGIHKTIPGPLLNGSPYNVTHLEVVTERGLERRLEYLSSDAGQRAVFLRQLVAKAQP